MGSAATPRPARLCLGLGGGVPPGDPRPHIHFWELEKCLYHLTNHSDGLGLGWSAQGWRNRKWEVLGRTGFQASAGPGAAL